MFSDKFVFLFGGRAFQKCNITDTVLSKTSVLDIRAKISLLLKINVRSVALSLCYFLALELVAQK